MTLQNQNIWWCTRENMQIVLGHVFTCAWKRPHPFLHPGSFLGLVYTWKRIHRRIHSSRAYNSFLYNYLLSAAPGIYWDPEPRQKLWEIYAHNTGTPILKSIHRRSARFLLLKIKITTVEENVKLPLSHSIVRHSYLTSLYCCLPTIEEKGATLQNISYILSMYVYSLPTLPISNPRWWRWALLSWAFLQKCSMEWVAAFYLKIFRKGKWEENQCWCRSSLMSLRLFSSFLREGRNSGSLSGFL